MSTIAPTGLINQAVSTYSRNVSPSAPKSDAQTAARADQALASQKQREQEREQRQTINELAARDREVRAHEAAHKAAAGPYAQGAPRYEFTTGPNGKRYAVGGSVEIDTSPVRGDPRATIAKADVIIRAALAPAQPSAQDQQVAAEARSMRQQAQAELIRDQESSGASRSEAERTTSDRQAPQAEAAVNAYRIVDALPAEA